VSAIRYRVETTDDEPLYLQVDLVEAAAPILAGFASDHAAIAWNPTPYCTANAHHDLRHAAALALEWNYPDTFDSPPSIREVVELSPNIHTT